MAKPNIYDNENFFENFKNLRTDKINFNDCIETPILLAMIPEVNGKKILDIGCGWVSMQSSILIWELNLY